MIIRKAKEKDIPRIMELLGQVLQIHAEIRPDVFIPGTTKYTDSELKELLEQEGAYTAEYDQLMETWEELSETIAAEEG